MTINSLRGKTILLTRPGTRSGSLQEKLERAGARAIQLPSMRIMPTDEPAKVLAQAACLETSDMLVFVSRNAVKYAAQLLPDIAGQASRRQVIAVGTGTRDELQGIGVYNVASTNSNAGSEALLEMEALRPENVSNKSITILRGTGGRALLGETLLARGARVSYLELYQRQKPAVTAAEMNEVWLDRRPDAVLVTSAEGLANLLEISGEECRPLFLNTRLVVISQRLQEIAESLGFKAAIGVAAAYSDEGFIAALTELLEANRNE